MNWLLLCAKLGQPTAGWFYPVHPLPPLVSLMARYVRLYGRLAGHRFPLPERCDLDRPERLVAWLAGQLAGGRPLVLRTMPSAAARLGVSAQASGHDLTGLTIVMGAEPVTDARRQQVEASGARAVVLYGSVETSGLAYSCATPRAADDVHVMLDRFALTQHRRAAIDDGPLVDSLLVTSLSPVAGMIAFNTEMGDYARLEQRACSCLLGQLGLTMHLSEIRSFEKLTGEGVTFASSNLQQILEAVLPARFGGTSLDYQLAEEETSEGAARLVLRVRPSVGELDADQLRAVLLEELGRGSAVERYHVQLWRAARTVEVRREEPHVTRAGKVLPFSLLRPPERVPPEER
jgi:phenylacetate-coenzyme A ligase PaaK-like adenylate-forming protein